jgi:hypothetical protein
VAPFAPFAAFAAFSAFAPVLGGAESLVLFYIAGIGADPGN